MLFNICILPWSMCYLHAANFPILAIFELIDNTPIKNNRRRFSPMENRVVCEELDKMLRACIFKPANIACSFPVVIVQK